jgi:serine/threonine-protein kinase RsbW
MAEVICAAPLTLAVEVHGRRPSLAVTGKADKSNISRMTDVLDRLVETHGCCVSIDLSGLKSIDTAAAECLANSANAYGSRRRRLHLRNASQPVWSVINRLMLGDAFCLEERCVHDSCPDKCAIASAELLIDAFTLPCSIEQCREARMRVDEVAEAAGFALADRQDVMIAVGEAVTNAIEHGGSARNSSSFTVICLAASGKLSISVSDTGSGFCLDDLPTLEEAFLQERGRGVHCMRAMMDEVSFEFGGGTTVKMVKFGP